MNCVSSIFVSYWLFILYLKSMALNSMFEFCSRHRHLCQWKLVVFKFYTKFDKLSLKTDKTKLVP